MRGAQNPADGRTSRRDFSGRTSELIKLINDLSPDLTIVLVEHDMDVVFAICDIITVLSYGKLLATGTKNEIQSNQQVIEAYLGQHHA